jgi:hypothetical protein
VLTVHLLLSVLMEMGVMVAVVQIIIIMAVMEAVVAQVQLVVPEVQDKTAARVDQAAQVEHHFKQTQ